MPHFVRRVFGRSKQEVRKPPAAITSPDSTDHDLTLQRLQLYLTGGSQTTSRETDPPAGDVGRQKQREAAGDLNERIAAILNEAEQAATDVRRRAQEEAERTRSEAQQQAAVDTEEARRRLEEDLSGLEKLRAELDRRRVELDDEAETHRRTKRREAEAAAEEIRSGAEEKAKEAERNAVALQRWLEETILSFHEVTDWLKRVQGNPPKTEPEAQDVDETVHEQIRDDACKPLNS